jgi:hypothetical protein
VVALEVPGDPLLAEVVCPTEVKDFFLHLRFRAELRVLRAGLAVNQSLLAIFLVRPLPAVEDFAGNAEMATGCGHVTDLFGVVENSQLFDGDLLFRDAEPMVARIFSPFRRRFYSGWRNSRSGGGEVIDQIAQGGAE